MAEAEMMLEDLFLDTLKDIYYAEKQIVRALPRMAKKAQSEELRQAFQNHAEQSQGHVERLDQIFEQLGKAARGKTCEAIQGILEEGKEIMSEYAGSDALDAGMISAAQAVEHYEIARYGTLRRWAQELGHQEAVKLLEQTLNEEKETDHLLTGIAEKGANQKSAGRSAEKGKASSRSTTGTSQATR